MPSIVRRAAAKVVKPVVSDAVWERLTSARRDGSPVPTAPAEPARPQRRQRWRAMDLTELGLECGTDKASSHNYTRHYERHFGHLRDQAFTLFEIGIGGAQREGKGGASLRMWKRYFPRAQVVGLDIVDKSFVAAPRIHIYQGDQTDEAVLRRIVDEHGPIEVIIDDGSHRPEHVRETFRILFPLLADGGLYAIEDTQTSYWPKWGGSTDRQDPTTTMSLVKELVDGLNHMEFLDEGYEPTYADLHVTELHAYHNLVILKKGTNQERTNRDRISGMGRPASD